jgi:macrolide transport system ATP-binding/permease protein
VHSIGAAAIPITSIPVIPVKERLMSHLFRDIKFALRQLGNAPGFTLTAVLTLALGIGANASIFTLVNAVLLRNLPVTDPKMLVRVGDNDDCCVNGGMPDKNDYSVFAYDLYLNLRDHTPEFEQLAAVESGSDTVTARREIAGAMAVATHGRFISGNYFQTLGLQPFAGRLVAPSDDITGAPMVATISYQAWQRDFAGDPSVIGSTFELNAHPVTISGVTPPSFYGDRMTDSPPDFYIPMAMEPVMESSSILHQHNLNWVYILGRIKPGVELLPLQDKMSAGIRQWLTELPIYQRAEAKKDLDETHTVLTPGGPGIANVQDEYGKGLHLLMAISLLVLLIACANIANLVLVRGLARRSETSVRIALGAQRGVVIRQMLTESLVLSCIGGVAGLAVASLGTRALLTLAFPHATSLPIKASPSPAVLGFAFALSMLTGLIFGVAPAWMTSHAEPADALRGSSRTTKDSSSLLQRSLVVLQAALSLVLLVAAGLLTKSLNRLEHQDFGVVRENRLVVHIAPATAGYQPTQLQGLYDEITQRFRALPGVEHVGLALYTPLEGNNWGEGVFIQGRPRPGLHDQIGASWTRVSPEFLDLVGQHLVRGRGILDRDTSTAPLVAVVNQAFVKHFFPRGEDPIGQHFGTEDVKSASEIEIVGIVTDTKYNNVRRPVRPMYFRPLLQQAPLSDGPSVRSLYAGAIMLQMKGPVQGFESQVRRTLSNINPNLTVVDYSTFDDQISGQFGQERLVARLTLMFGILALILASIGLYGVTAYVVARRTAEIGIRMALGASRGLVVKNVLREAMLQTAIGLAVGVPVVLLCVRFVKDQLYDIGGYDPTVISVSLVVLIASSAFASLIPAMRAASIDPVQALRTE